MNRPIPTEGDIPMHGWHPYSIFHRERIRAHAKHQASGGSMEQKDWNDPKCLRIALEEFGEIAKAFNDIAKAFNDYDLGVIPNEAELHSQVTKELVQLGAMISAWTESAMYSVPR